MNKLLKCASMVTVTTGTACVANVTETDRPAAIGHAAALVAGGCPDMMEQNLIYFGGATYRTVGIPATFAEEEACEDRAEDRCDAQMRVSLDAFVADCEAHCDAMPNCSYYINGNGNTSCRSDDPEQVANSDGDPLSAIRCEAAGAQNARCHCTYVEPLPPPPEA